MHGQPLPRVQPEFVVVTAIEHRVAEGVEPKASPSPADALDLAKVAVSAEEARPNQCRRPGIAFGTRAWPPLRVHAPERAKAPSSALAARIARRPVVLLRGVAGAALVAAPLAARRAARVGVRAARRVLRFALGRAASALHAVLALLGTGHVLAHLHGFGGRAAAAFVGGVGARTLPCGRAVLSRRPGARRRAFGRVGRRRRGLGGRAGRGSRLRERNRRGGDEGDRSREGADPDFHDGSFEVDEGSAGAVAFPGNARTRSVSQGPMWTSCRRTSARLQACAMQPRGVYGASASKISAMEATPKLQSPIALAGCQRIGHRDSAVAG